MERGGGKVRGMEDIRFTGGRHNSLAISVLRTLPASVSVMPRT